MQQFKIMFDFIVSLPPHASTKNSLQCIMGVLWNRSVILRFVTDPYVASIEIVRTKQTLHNA